MKYLLLVMLISSSIVTSLMAQDKYIASESLKSFNNDTFLAAKILRFDLSKRTKSGDTILLTKEDKHNLSTFFLVQKGVLACHVAANSTAISVVSQKKVDDNQVFVAADIASILKTKGYIINTIKRGYNDVLCSARGPVAPAMNLGIAEMSEHNKNCTDCGEVKLSSNITEKFKETEYEMPLLDISFEN